MSWRSDDAHTRESVMLALGRRPHPDLPELTYVECATEPVVIKTMDAEEVPEEYDCRSGCELDPDELHRVFDSPC